MLTEINKGIINPPISLTRSIIQKYSSKIFKIQKNNRKKESAYKRCHLTVGFFENLSTEQVNEIIHQLDCPQIVIWYIGCYGLRKAGVDFYRDFLISPILKKNPEATFWLVDLAGWNAFKTPQGSIHKSNSCCDKIESFQNPKIKCIRSSKIFKKMQDLDQSLVNFFKKSLEREFIHELSKNFPETKILVKEVFLNNCPVAANWFNCDVSKCYSVFQYLEGCLLVEELFFNMVKKNRIHTIEIVFALPNSEINYYRDELESFKNDVDFLISNRCENMNLENIHLNIKFLAFKYGNQSTHRPYNAPGTVLKKRDLFHEHIVG